LRTRILIVDDHLIARTAIRCLLDGNPFAICGEARDGKEAIEKVIELKPDIILLDINMPVMDGIRAAREIRLISPEAKIIFLTIHDFPAFRDATQRLSHAFVTKHEAAAELISVLNRLAETTPDHTEIAGEIPSRALRQSADAVKGPGGGGVVI
jgi:DNA-binding NarL/FixJ family response regulator